MIWHSSLLPILKKLRLVIIQLMGRQSVCSRKTSDKTTMRMRITGVKVVFIVLLGARVFSTVSEGAHFTQHLSWKVSSFSMMIQMWYPRNEGSLYWTSNIRQVLPVKCST